MDKLCEPVELDDVEMDAVAGGGSFGFGIANNVGGNADHAVGGNADHTFISQSDHSNINIVSNGAGNQNIATNPSSSG